MNIKFIAFKKTSGKDFCLFTRLYKDYITELSKHSSRIRSNPVRESQLFDICRNPDLERYFISCDEQIVGFLLVGINGNKHEDSNRYIAEFYISEEFQSKGIGKAAAERYIRENPGAYCLYILRENARAIYFWSSVFFDLKYVETSWKYPNMSDRETFFKMYEQKDLQRELPLDANVC